MTALRLVCLLHARLLALYPARYRQAFAEERQAVFQLAAEAAVEAGSRTFLSFILQELLDLPLAALMEHLHGRRGWMIASLRTLLSEKPDRWGASVLAGLPHVLSAAVYFAPALFASYNPIPFSALLPWYNFMMRFPLTHWGLNLTAEDSYWIFQRVLFQTQQWLFGLLVLVMVLVGWKRKWPRWSATWAGYGLILLLRSFIEIFPDDTGSLIAILVWFVAAIFVYIRITRLSPLMGLMALLPFYPMFFWLLAADGILGTKPEAIGYVASGLLMSLMVAFSARTGSFKLALILLAGVILIAGGGFAYGNVYYSNAPFPQDPTPGKVIASTLGGFPTLLLIGLPVWATTAWAAYRRKAKAS